MKPMDVDGMVTAAEAAALSRYAAATDGKIVEVGAYRGRTTLALAAGEKDVTVIDPFEDWVAVTPLYPAGYAYSAENFDIWKANIEAAGVVERVQHVRQRSPEAALAWSEPIGLIFLDGDHTEAAVRADFDAWQGFVPVGGTIALHDINEPGVESVVNEMVGSGEWVMVERVDLLVFLQRVALDLGPAVAPVKKSKKK